MATEYNPLRWSSLKNGIQVISQAFPTANLAGVGFMVGSLYDPPKQRGMAHLAEHMMAQRSTRHSVRDVDLTVLKCMGGYDGDVNIRVDRVSTFFGFNDLNTHADMHTGWEVFAQMTLDGLLDARGKLKEHILDVESLDVEKAAVHNEYRLRGTDLPESEITDLLYQTMWRNNPVRNRIDCEPDELARVTLSEVKQFIKHWYKTSRMFTIFIGPEQPEARAMAEKYFGKLRFSEGEGPLLHGETQPQIEGIRHVEMIHPGARQHHVVHAFPTGLHDSPDGEALDVLAKVLGFRAVMKLRQGNREFNHGVYRAPAFTERSFAHGILYTHFATVGSYDYALQGSEAMMTLCEELKRKRRSASERADLESEIEAAKYNMDKYELNAFRRHPDALVEIIIDAVCNGDRNFQRLNGRRNRIAAVDIRAVLKAAERYLTTPDRFVRVVLKPLLIPREIYDRTISAAPEIEPYLTSFRPVS